MLDRLNPFTSSAKKRLPLDESEDRQSSSLDTDGDSGDTRATSVYLHAPPPSPTKRRNPSILRTLAHHPSLSALRSRKKHAIQKQTPPIPTSTSAPWSRLSDGVDGRLSQSPSPSKRKSKNVGLKGSHSVPRDLRLSGGSGNSARRSIEQDNRYPTPPSLTLVESRQTQTPVRERRPSPLGCDSPYTAGYTTQNEDWRGPDDVRIRSMRFEIEIENESPRKRAASDSAGLPPPFSKIERGSLSLRGHLSSPGRASSLPVTPDEASSARPIAPFTTQHPHPVPLAERTSRSLIEDFDTTSFYDPGDFIPLTQSGHTAELDDGLELLVSQEDLPIGTPGGTKADLKRGALVDGAKHEKHAVRFFSRDTYGPPLSSTPTDPDATKDDRRSSSPFEVKLSPMVAQRMSLVAFGSLSPPISEDNLTNSAIEEPVEEEPEPPALSHFLGTSLSTIKESPSSRGDQSTSAEVASPLPAMQFTTLAEAPVDDRTSGRCQPRTPRSSENRSRTIYFTPTSSPVRQSNGLPLPMESPFLPPRHHSAPPLAVTVALLNGHSEHTSSLQNELRQSRAVVDALNSDLQHDRDIIKEQEQDIARYIEHLRQKDSCIGKLEERFAESVEASTGLREESCVQKKSLDQLRAALDQTQVAHEDLQLSHEDLASRYVDILQERDALVSAGQQDANTLNSVHDDQVAMKQEVKVLRKVKKEAAAQRIESERNTMELQRVLAEMEAQIDATTDDYAAHLASHQDELGTAQRQAIDKNVLIVELQKQLHDSEMQHAAVCTRMNTELDSAQRELAEHTDRVSELESQLQAISNESGTCTDYTSQVGKDLNDALYLGAEKDRVISALRDKLQMTAFERDELRVRTDGLLEECYEMERIAGETERDAAARSAAEMSASMEEERRVWADERVEVIDLLNQVSNQVSSDEGLIASLDSQLRTTLDELANARLDVDGLRTDLKNKTDSLEHDQSEIRHLCRAVADAEEALVRAREDSDRDIKEMRRAAKHHDEQLHDCQSRLASQEVQVQRAFVDVADRRAQADDAHYRLTAYLSEIDRLKLVEAGLGKEIGDLRRSSASEEMRRVDLSKRIIELEKDKDLLNVALDSKQTELVLLQRSTRPTSLTATPWHQRSVPLVTSATSSRRSQTPTPQAVAPTAESTPAPSRRQSGSVSSSSVRAKDGHRNSLTCSTPSTPRMTVRQPLGASTKHNRTPEKRSQTPVISVASANAKQSELKRRSSLPVLVGRAEGVSEKTAMFGSLAEVEEAAETLG